MTTPRRIMPKDFQYEGGITCERCGKDLKGKKGIKRGKKTIWCWPCSKEYKDYIEGRNWIGGK